MKNTLLIVSLTIVSFYGLAQNGIGIRTATPHSKLTIAGSLSTNFRSFTGTTTATVTDNILVFTGSAAQSIVLPSAVGIMGRHYVIKNASTNLPISILTIAPAASENIDGLSSWVLDGVDVGVTIISNGANWYVSSQNLPAPLGTHWNQNGNNVISESSVGPITDYDFSFITNSTEKMRLSNTGNLGIGASTFVALNPEKLLVDQGTFNSYNAISGRGSYDNYLQLNIHNNSAGDMASSDVVASNNTATESANFIDIGINSSGFNNPTYPVLDGPNNTYLYSTGNDLVIGNGTAGKNLSFFAGGTGVTNEWMRIDPTGLVGIGTTILPLTEKLQIDSNIRLSGLNRSIFFDASGDPYSGIKNISRTGEVNELMLFAGNEATVSNGPDRIRLATNEIHFATSATDGTVTTGDPGSFYADTVAVPTRLFINQNGNTAIGNTGFDALNPQQLLVDAGATTSYNVMSGKGSINSYLQLNIQNTSGGGAASSDIVATADNGNESVNYVNLGINSDGYSGSGITAGANNAYLFSTGNDLVIGTSTDTRIINFYTTTGGVSTQRIRISNAGLLAAQDNVYSLGNSTNRFSEIWSLNGTIQTSDRRLKKNIRPLSYGLKEIMLLNPVGYNWIDEKNKSNKIGLIAQEVKNVIPEVVVGQEEKENLGMNYAEMVPVLINAIKELKNKLEILKVKAKELE